MNEKMSRIDALGDFFVKTSEEVDAGASQVDVDYPLVRAVVDTLCGTKAERDYLHTVILERLGQQGASMLKGFIEWVLNAGWVDREEEKRPLHASAGFLAYLCRDADMARFHADQSEDDSLSGLVLQGVELMDSHPPEGLIASLVSEEMRETVVMILEAESV